MFGGLYFGQTYFAGAISIILPFQIPTAPACGEVLDCCALDPFTYAIGTGSTPPTTTNCPTYDCCAPNPFASAISNGSPPPITTNCPAYDCCPANPFGYSANE